MQLPEWLNRDQLLELATVWGLKLLAALAVLIIGWLVVSLISRGVAKSFQRARVDITLSAFLVRVVHAVLLIIVVIAALDQLGVQMTSALAILGAAGLAIALSLQGSLSNFASGTMLVAARPMRVGDYVDCAGVSGTVDHVGIFYTQLHTGDNQIITLANTLVLAQPLINYSTCDTRRFNETIRIAYDDDIDAAKQVIQQVFDQESRLLADPSTEIVVNALDVNHIEIAARAWIRSDIFWAVRSDLLQNLKVALDTAGFGVPYPRQAVQLVAGDGKVDPSVETDPAQV